jgi:hypothetical protein
MLVLVIVVLAVAGYWVWRQFFTGEEAKITFAPYAEDYAVKPDFASVEHNYPLTAKQLMTLTPENIRNLDQEQVDQIYARLTAGPIPDGAFDGDLFFPKGMSGQKRLGEIVGGVKGWAADLELAKLTVLGKALWKGKVFYREQRVLRNRIDHLEVLTELFPDDADQAKLRELSVNGRTDQLYFPAKLYCGQSLIDSRRESVIIDYAFTDEIEGYREVPDKLAGREMLVVRDEIRMVRPGFYLGRAYLAGTFILNFTLYNKNVADAGTPGFMAGNSPAEDCWVGYQRLAAK